MKAPRFIPVDRSLELPDGSAFVVSFAEILGDSTVIRLHVLRAEFVSRFTGPGFGLRDDRGGDFEWRSSASGGMIPGEVLLQFAGMPSVEARSIALYRRSDEVVLFSVALRS